MKPLLVNTYDRGGAGKACVRLHLGLHNESIDSSLLLKKKANQMIPNSYEYFQKVKNYGIEERVKRWFYKKSKSAILQKREIDFVANRNKNLTIYTYPYSEERLTKQLSYLDSDIINLHWVANFLDWEHFFLENAKPIVWTLHDQNPFLGGEHYAEKYIDIDNDGLPINRVYSKEELLEEKRLMDYKSKILESVSNLHIVSPSKWLKKESEKSALFSQFPHYNIPNGFPISIFKLLDKSYCREALNLPKDKVIILFVSELIENYRKGFIFLQRAFDEIIKEQQNTPFVLCSVGATKQETDEGFMSLGSIHEESKMAQVYAAADVFIIPSLEDNFPNTMIESLLCGTPVIGFNTGGIPDAIINGKTGYLCPKISVKSLVKTIKKFLENPNQFNGEEIAKEAKEKYSLEVQAKAYVELYESILSKKK